MARRTTVRRRRANIWCGRRAFFCAARQARRHRHWVAVHRSCVLCGSCCGLRRLLGIYLTYQPIGPTLVPRRWCDGVHAAVGVSLVRRDSNRLRGPGCVRFLRTCGAMAQGTGQCDISWPPVQLCQTFARDGSPHGLTPQLKRKPTYACGCCPCGRRTSLHASWPPVRCHPFVFRRLPSGTTAQQS